MNRWSSNNILTVVNFFAKPGIRGFATKMRAWWHLKFRDFPCRSIAWAKSKLSNVWAMHCHRSLAGLRRAKIMGPLSVELDNYSYNYYRLSNLTSNEPSQSRTCIALRQEVNTAKPRSKKIHLYNGRRIWD